MGSFFSNQPPDGVDPGDSLILWNDIKSGKVGEILRRTRSYLQLKSETALWLQATLPFPVYILGPVHESQTELFSDLNGCELADNLVYLGRGGCLMTNEGLTVAYLSGASTKHSDPRMRIDAAKQIRTLEARTGCEAPDFKGVDVLITSDWPSGISSNAGEPVGFLDKEDESARTLVARLALKLKPR